MKLYHCMLFQIIRREFIQRFDEKTWFELIENMTHHWGSIEKAMLKLEKIIESGSLRGLINAGFVWSYTPQGMRYWSEKDMSWRNGRFSMRFLDDIDTLRYRYRHTSV